MNYELSHNKIMKVCFGKLRKSTDYSDSTKYKDKYVPDKHKSISWTL